MIKKWIRKLKRIHRLFKRITIEKQQTLTIDLNDLQLVIVRRMLPDGRPYNTVWLMGRHDTILHRLYRWDGSPSSLGRKFSVQMKSYNYWIVIRRHNNLRSLCRKCGIKKIIMVQFSSPVINA